MADNDELVSQFLAFTGSADTDRAASYLEMSGGDLETAVGLYMEHQGGGVGGAAGGGGAGSAAAGSTAGGGGMMGGDVRAPDATQSARLIDDSYGGGMGMMGALMGSHLPPYMRMDPTLEAQLASSAFASLGNNNDDDDDENMGSDGNSGDNGEEKDDGEQGSSSRKNSNAGLADMFAPPHHLLFKEGGFEGAREMAKSNRRWLLVNLQRDSEFACHALNRDVWRDELAENLIREGFVFWQDMDISPEGQVYSQRYHVYDYPHVAIIDPRTRRLLWKKEGWTQQNPLTASQFAEMAMDFCSRHSFDKPPQAPRSSGASSRPAKRPVQEMSEDEQLQAAMRASLGESAGGADDDDDNVEYEMEDDDDEVEVLDGNLKSEEGPGGSSVVEESEPEAKKKAEPSMLDELLSSTVEDEPAKGARVQIKMPDGSRKVRRFDGSKEIKSIYAFVAHHMKENMDECKEFVLQTGHPPKDLLSDIDNTIDSCSLSGASILVRWKD
eukprot:CAMPEP_0113509438 /NCGR_PEP_ID=MMETSP0014_2-20120614/37578_1 /TAXON_ID=2857 /ORGANISM="Nitzschia sp." /LENGTH=496 /DNA_ID=CAMNT_0000405273 /DNA_START=92 /DNA_END=1582 /DNA_ORIENTATION=+ /assembly_acc=CAM_ASM_000159